MFEKGDIGVQYFVNSVAVYGVICLVLAGILSLPRRMAKDYWQTTFDLAMRVIGTIAVVWMLLGTGMGFVNQITHQACLAEFQASGKIEGCQSVFNQYGPYPPGIPKEDH